MDGTQVRGRRHTNRMAWQEDSDRLDNVSVLMIGFRNDECPGSGNPPKRAASSVTGNEKEDATRSRMHVMGLPEDAYAAHGGPMRPHINVGADIDIVVARLVHTVCRVVGFECRIDFDTNRPDGAPRKPLDVSRLNDLGWKA